ncbi:MAG: arylamine N-acetyltransferase [Micromonosporaceae bacterium]|nr:arylamine N-acetyltransferase [Micromonosporaceae bacterium]
MARLAIDDYLNRLGIRRVGSPSVDGLRTLHHAHVERVPYETISLQLGRAASIEPSTAAARIISGYGGYCFQLNGAFSLLLRALGYQVQMHLGGVTGHDAAEPVGADGNHMVLTVAGLPERACPEGVWLVDVGLGDALYEPLPLRTGVFRQQPFVYRLSHSEAAPGGWRFDHDPTGAFTRMDFSPAPAAWQDFCTMHLRLSTDPESHFLRTATAQRRYDGGATLLRGCVLTSLTAAGVSQEVFDTPQSWFVVLAEVFGLTLPGVTAADRDALWQRVVTSHERWLATR